MLCVTSTMVSQVAIVMNDVDWLHRRAVQTQCSTRLYCNISWYWSIDNVINLPRPWELCRYRLTWNCIT